MSRRNPKHRPRYVGQIVNLDTPERVYKVAIRNEAFYKESHRSRLVNILLDLYYEKTLEQEENLQEILDEVKEVTESGHEHDWDFVDKGNYISGSGLLFRYVCNKCGNYKRVDEDMLHAGMNHIIDTAEDSEPTLLIPEDDGEQSEGNPQPSVYD